MPKHEIKLIVNPNADLGRAWRQTSDLKSVAEEFGGADWSGTVYPTHAVELAREAAFAGYELVVAVGGDGTVHEVVNGLMQAPPERRPRLGVVPLGSGNDYAHALGMDRRSAYALRQVFTGEASPVDVMALRDSRGRLEYVNNTAGFGFDAAVTIRSRNFPFLRGFLIYLLSVFQTILLDYEAPRFRVATDQESWERQTLMLTACNGPREGGGFLVAPQARLDDGWVECVSVDRVSRPVMLRLLMEVMQGTHFRMPQVHLSRFKKLTLEADRPLHIHTDGEVFAGFGVDVRSVSMELEERSLMVMRPRRQDAPNLPGSPKDQGGPDIQGG